MGISHQPIVRLPAMRGLLQHCGLFEIACFHDRQRRGVDMTAEGGGNLLRRKRRHFGFQRLIPFHGAAPKLAVSQSADQALPATGSPYALRATTSWRVPTAPNLEALVLPSAAGLRHAAEDLLRW